MVPASMSRSFDHPELNLGFGGQRGSSDGHGQQRTNPDVARRPSKGLFDVARKPARPTSPGAVQSGRFVLPTAPVSPMRLAHRTASRTASGFATISAPQTCYARRPHGEHSDLRGWHLEPAGGRPPARSSDQRSQACARHLARWRGAQTARFLRLGIGQLP